MLNLKEKIAKEAYQKVRNKTISEAMVVAAIEAYLKTRLTDSHKMRIRGYIKNVQDGKMTFDECWALYNSKAQSYESHP